MITMLFSIGRLKQLQWMGRLYSTHRETVFKPETQTAQDGSNLFASSTATFSGGSFQQDRLMAESAAKVTSGSHASIRCISQRICFCHI